MGWRVLACVIVLGACSATVEPPRTGSERSRPTTNRTDRLGPSNATCDPEGCSAYCVEASCGQSAEACLERCNAVCGDGYFDDRDGPVMTCVLGRDGDGCAALRTCCGLDYTSQLCNEVH